MTRLSPVDVSFDGDLLAEGSADPGLPVIVDFKNAGNQEKSTNQIMEQPLQPSESSVQAKSRSRRSFSQQSLDWHRDFLTSEGVLNHEELSIINSTFKKTEPCSLSIIHEDPKRSMNDDDTLEDLEVHLFENARASIQKTLDSGEKALELENSSKKNNPAKEAPKKVESSSPNKTKSPVVPARHQQHQQTATWASVVAKVIKSGDKITSSKAVSRPSKLWQKAATLTVIPAKINFARGNTQTGTNNRKDKPANVVQKTALESKKINGGPYGSNSKSSQTMKPSLNSVSNSSATANKDNTRIAGSRRATTSSYGAIANKASTKTGKTTSVKSNASNPALSESTSVKLTLCTSPASAGGSGVSSASYSLALLGMDSDEVCSSPSFERANNNKAHSPRLSLGDPKDISLRLQTKQTSQNNHVTSIPSRGNHPRNSTNNSSGAKLCTPSGLKNSLGRNVGTPTQQSKFSKAITGMSRTDYVNKQTNSKIQHGKHAAHKRTSSGDSAVTQTSISSRRSRNSSISLP